MNAWLIPISLWVLADVARADQCEWVDAAAAQKAKAILQKSPKYLEFCEPCGDKAPGVPAVATSVAITDQDGDYKAVAINGKDVDLAYTFVKTDDAHYQNLAALAGCSATGVSPSLTIQDETKNGVLITADETWPLPTVMQTPTPTAVTSIPAQAPPQLVQAPPQVYVYNTTTHEVAWFAIALAACGGFITGSTLTLALLAVRRRRSMKPRAVDIMPPR